MGTEATPNAKGRAASTEVELARLVGVIADLREHCRWTAALTHASLVPYLIEESYELADVVEAQGPLDAGALKGELGDVLYQVVLHSLLQSETGGFTLADVAATLRSKLVRRNRHVFRPDGSLQDHFPASIAEIERSYEAAKAMEKDHGHSVFDSLPASLPALSLAAKTLDRVAGRTGDRDPAIHPGETVAVRRKRKKSWASCCSRWCGPPGRRAWMRSAHFEWQSAGFSSSLPPADSTRSARRRWRLPGSQSASSW